MRFERSDFPRTIIFAGKLLGCFLCCFREKGELVGRLVGHKKTGEAIFLITS